jgi:lipopolysaccharide export system protein LptA
LPHATLGAGVLALGVLLGVAVHAQAPISTETAPAAPTPAAAPTQTSAPAVGSSFGALSKNSGQPIDIESDVLVVHDAKKYATFKGNVKAVQGTTTLRATELDVHYVGGGSDSLTGGQGATAANADAKAGDAKAEDPKPGGGGALGGDGTQISKIEARGEVIITSDQDQTTTSDWALYDVPAQQVTVGGNVVLMQGKNVLKGDRLVIDLKTGESRFENPGNAAAPGRIRALFMPKDAKPGDDKKADDKKADDKKADDKKADDKKVDDKKVDDKKADEKKADDKKASDKTADDQSGSESSENANAPANAANGAESHPDSEAWQLLPGQQR